MLLRVSIFACFTELCSISDTLIAGYSKSDTLAKILFCLQTLWFVTQVISRRLQHMIVTLLEVEATGLFVCALVAYIIWWQKPHSCAFPLVIECDDMDFACLSELSPLQDATSSVDFIGRSIEMGGQNISRAFSGCGHYDETPCSYVLVLRHHSHYNIFD